MNIEESNNYYVSTNESYTKNANWIVQLVDQIKHNNIKLPIELLQLIYGMLYQNKFYVLTFTIEDLLNMQYKQEFYFLCFWINKWKKQYILEIVIQDRYDIERYKNPIIIPYNISVQKIQYLILAELKKEFVKGYKLCSR